MVPLQKNQRQMRKINLQLSLSKPKWSLEQSIKCYVALIVSCNNSMATLGMSQFHKKDSN